jgi:phospholipid N-methyltransferase
MKGDALWKNIDKNTTPGTAFLHPTFWTMVKPGDLVIEVGSGNGRVIEECLARKLRVAAIDINPNELGELRKRYMTNKNVSLEELDVTKSKPLKRKIAQGAILLGLVGALDSPAGRKRALTNVAASLEIGGALCVSEFVYSPTDPVLSHRYKKAEAMGLEKGSFVVDEADGSAKYITHNFQEAELVRLVEADFTIIKLEKTMFTSYHGNERKGISLIAKKK